MEYIKISNKLDCIEADKMLNELIKYESGFDKVINGNSKVSGFHDEVLDKSQVFAYYVKDNAYAYAFGCDNHCAYSFISYIGNHKCTL